MTRQTKAPKPDALKTWMAWGKNAMQLLQAKGVDLSAPSPALNRRVEAMVVARAHAEAVDRPKIHLTYEYPIELFLRGCGGRRFNHFESSLPATVEISKLYIPFVDGSAMLIRRPSEETLQCGLFVQMLADRPDLAKIMGVEADQLGALRELPALVEAPTIVAVAPEEIAAMLAREVSLAQMGAEPQVRVNFSSTRIPARQAVSLLKDFFEAPSDTLKAAVTNLFPK